MTAEKGSLGKLLVGGSDHLVSYTRSLKCPRGTQTEEQMHHQQDVPNVYISYHKWGPLTGEYTVEDGDDGQDDLASAYASDTPIAFKLYSNATKYASSTGIVTKLEPSGDPSKVNSMSFEISMYGTALTEH